MVEKKGVQAAVGAAAGGTLTPIFGKIGNAVAARVGRLLADKEATGARASMGADRAIADALAEVGQRAEDLPEAYLQGLRTQVVDALKAGKELDAAALLRAGDFEKLGIKPTAGQVTRDASQFARERNLRAVPGVGDPLLNRFTEQGRQLSDQIGAFGGRNAAEAAPASNRLHAALGDIDESMRAGVTAAYNTARKSAGKDAEIPLAGLAQDVASTIENFGDKVPSGVRNQFRALGIDPDGKGVQTKLLTLEGADRILKVINDHVGMDAATNKALRELRQAVKSAVLSVDDAGGPFAPAISAASKRFSLHEAIPALEGAASGRVSPDDFVQRFVVGGKPGEVNRLAGLLKLQAPEAYDEARNQLGAVLQRAAFGENPAGDKMFRPESFQKALRNLGTEKLKAFFSPEEIAQMQTLSRVGAYINATPQAAPVLGNPNMVWAGPLLSKVAPLNALTSVLAAAGRAAAQGGQVTNALAAQVPSKAAALTPEQIRQALMARSLGGLAAGQAAGRGLNQ
jgi:hypothetical protein